MVSLVFPLTACSNPAEPVKDYITSNVETINTAVKLSMKQDIQNAHIALQTEKVSSPTAALSTVSLTTSNNNVVLTATGTLDQYIITAVYTPTGFTYTFDSQTGITS